MSDDQQAAREAAITELWISESRMGDPAELTPTNWMNKAFDAGWDARGVWERGRGVPEADEPTKWDKPAKVAVAALAAATPDERKD